VKLTTASETISTEVRTQCKRLKFIVRNRLIRQIYIIKNKHYIFRALIIPNKIQTDNCCACTPKIYNPKILPSTLKVKVNNTQLMRNSFKIQCIILLSVEVRHKRISEIRSTYTNSNYIAIIIMFFSVLLHWSLHFMYRDPPLQVIWCVYPKWSILIQIYTEFASLHHSHVLSFI
jgi:hypothetical protein